MLLQPPLEHRAQIAFSYARGEADDLKRQIAEALEPRLRAHPLLSGRDDQVAILRNEDYVGIQPREFVAQYAKAVLIVMILGDRYFENIGTMAEWKLVVDLKETRADRIFPVYLREGPLETALKDQYGWFCGGLRYWQGETAEAIAAKVYEIWERIVESWTAVQDYTILHFEESDSAGQEVGKLIEQHGMSAHQAVRFHEFQPKLLPQESYCCIAPKRLSGGTQRTCERFLTESGLHSSLQPLWIVTGEPKQEETPAGWSAVSVSSLGDRLHTIAMLDTVNIICGDDIGTALMKEFRGSVSMNIRIWLLKYLHTGRDRLSMKRYPFSSLFARARTSQHNFVALSPGLASDAAALWARIGKANVDALFAWLLDEERDQPWQIVRGAAVSRADRMALSPLPLACDDVLSVEEYLRQLPKGRA